MISESMGKILGMAMAYGVSSLGLLLAYYNYRKRIIKAERIFTPVAWTIMAGIVGIVVLAVVFMVMLAQKTPVKDSISAQETEIVSTTESEELDTAAVREAVEIQPVEGEPAITREIESRQGEFSILGVIIPAAIFLVSLWITFALYRHFSRKLSVEMKEER